jgi:peroxiredoxin
MKHLIRGRAVMAVAAVASLAVTSLLGSAPAGEPDAARPKAPEFPAGAEWLNSKPLKLTDLKGQVVVVHFWTFGCINCIHNYPAYKAWHERFAGEGVTIVGVHTPEFEAEKDVGRVRKKVADHKLKFPVVIDNDGAIWKAWGNRLWPSIYLVDKRGVVRSRYEGELSTEGKAAVRRKIEALLAEPAPR